MEQTTQPAPREQRPRRRWGDRRDGVWLRDVDALHGFTPYLFPNRADNEAFIEAQIDLTNIEAYLERKNAGEPAHRYTIFHVIAAAAVKCFVLRPRMNRFIQGSRMYQRNVLTLSFVVKKQFNDESHEALAFLYCDGDTTIDTLHEAIVKEITEFRGGRTDNSTDGMDMLLKLPRWVLTIVIRLLHLLDYYGRVPEFLVKTDPNYASIFLSNLGSIKLNAGYHHLTNWGTTSFFGVIGERHMAQLVDAEGNVSLRPVLDLGLTIDERIADGYYYSKTVRLLKHLLQHPELLELPASTEVDYEV